MRLRGALRSFVVAAAWLFASMTSRPSHCAVRDPFLTAAPGPGNAIAGSTSTAEPAGSDRGTVPGEPASPGLPLAPAFTLPDLRGTLVESAYASRPVTMVHFWASWCVPCMREIPVLNQWAAAYEPKGAGVFAVAMSSGSASEVRQLIKAYNIRHTVLLGTESLAVGFGGLASFPTTFLVDREGKVFARFTGTSEKIQASIEAKLRLALGLGDPPKDLPPPAGR
jgi:thiol-disulfide isomerase/thioredoxin